MVLELGNAHTHTHPRFHKKKPRPESAIRQRNPENSKLFRRGRHFEIENFHHVHPALQTHTHTNPHAQWRHSSRVGSSACVSVCLCGLSLPDLGQLAAIAVECNVVFPLPMGFSPTVVIAVTWLWW